MFFFHSSEDESNKISSKKHKDGHRGSHSSSSKDVEKLLLQQQKTRENKDHKHRSKSAEDRRKSTSSQASNASGSNKNQNKNREMNNVDQNMKIVKKMRENNDLLNSDSESDFSGVDADGNEPKKFSIFDDPIIDPDNPVYFSMYDKVKARRSCVARRDREENERRQQEALLAKFSKMKAKKDKKKNPGSDSDSDDDDEGLFLQ